MGCGYDSTHLSRRRGLEYLVSRLDADEQRTLLLPMLIELGAKQDEAVIICGGKVEEKIISKALNMPITCAERRIRIYKPRPALQRRKFKTTTIYILC